MADAEASEYKLDDGRWNSIAGYQTDFSPYVLAYYPLGNSGGGPTPTPECQVVRSVPKLVRVNP
jgi:hypothetical protein